MRFTLRTDKWYACEIIGDAFDEDLCSYSPIKVKKFVPLGTGASRFRLHFYHANYPQGVNDKIYDLQMVLRGKRFLLARSTDYDPPRILQIYDINWSWMKKHFSLKEQADRDLYAWLDRNV